MRRTIAALLPMSLLAGCSGYAIDYTKPKNSIIGPELTRYGFDNRQSQCLGARLGAGLTVWQLRQLQLRAAALTQGYADPSRLSPGDLLWVAQNVRDKRVGPAVAAAAEACGISARASVAAAAPPPRSGVRTAPAPAPSGAAAAAAAAASTWVNLGAAASGQSIAVDAASLGEQGSYRSGWFRLTNPGQSTRASPSYLLRVDCAGRTINSMAVRKHGANGAVTEQRSFGPNGEGAAPVENGTVMQIAYLALCT